MADLDLAALTEAVAERLDEGDEVQLSGAWPGTSSFVDGPLSAIVRAVLEALPREWGVRTTTASSHVARLTWERDEAMARTVHASRQERTPAFDVELVWRAVGPPIPAEEET